MKNLVLYGLLFAVSAFAVGLANERYAWVDFGINQEASKVVCDNPPLFEKQIINLPEDGNAYFTSLFLPGNWQNDPKSREIVAWFETNNQLKSLKAQTHWHIYTADSAWYTNRYRNMAPVIPAVVIQKADGQKVYHRSGDQLPRSASGLAADIQGNLYTNCPRRHPEPEPEPEPAPDLDDQGPPDLTGGGEQAGWDGPGLLAVIGLFVGLAAGAGTKYYEQHYTQNSGGL